MPNGIQNPSEDAIVETLRAELANSEPSRRRRAIEKFVLAALGSIPWVGGFLSAAASYKTEEGAIRQDSLQTQWLQEHHQKLLKLKGTLEDVQRRFDSLGDSIEARIQSDEYLGLVRKTFRAWDQADTDEKRRYTANLIVNAAGTRVCSDDVVRLFLDWLPVVSRSSLRRSSGNFSEPRIEPLRNLVGALR